MQKTNIRDSVYWHLVYKEHSDQLCSGVQLSQFASKGVSCRSFSRCYLQPHQQPSQNRDIASYQLTQFAQVKLRQLAKLATISRKLASQVARQLHQLLSVIRASLATLSSQFDYIAWLFLGGLARDQSLLNTGTNNREVASYVRGVSLAASYLLNSFQVAIYPYVATQLAICTNIGLAQSCTGWYSVLLLGQVVYLAA